LLLFSLTDICLAAVPSELVIPLTYSADGALTDLASNSDLGGTGSRLRLPVAFG
jgi:hypothetical protein